MEEIKFRVKRSLFDRFGDLIYGVLLLAVPLFGIVTPIAMMFDGESFNVVWLLFFGIGLIGMYWSYSKLRSAASTYEEITTSNPETIAKALKSGWVPLTANLDADVVAKQAKEEAKEQRERERIDQAQTSARSLRRLGYAGYLALFALVVYQFYVFLKTGVELSIPLSVIVAVLPQDIQASYYNPVDWIGLNSIIKEMLSWPLALWIFLVSAFISYLGRDE